jgi:hypothetical protein
MSIRLVYNKSPGSHGKKGFEDDDDETSGTITGGGRGEKE